MSRMSQFFLWWSIESDYLNREILNKRLSNLNSRSIYLTKLKVKVIQSKLYQQLLRYVSQNDLKYISRPLNDSYILKIWNVKVTWSFRTRDCVHDCNLYMILKQNFFKTIKLCSVFGLSGMTTLYMGCLPF